MPQNQQSKGNMGSNMKSRTNPQKVKQQIQNDVSHGQGAMTSREAGAMRD